MSGLKLTLQLKSGTSTNIAPHTCKGSCRDLMLSSSLGTNLFLPHGSKDYIHFLLLTLAYTSQSCCGIRETCVFIHTCCVFSPPVYSSVWPCGIKGTQNVWRLQSIPEIKLYSTMTAAKQEAKKNRQAFMMQ